MPENQNLLFSLQFQLGRRGQQDEETTTETEQRKNAEEGACSVSVKFFPKGAFKPLIDVKNAWVKEVKKLTVPWESTIRLCPGRAQPEVARICDQKAPEFSSVKTQLLETQYPTWAETAPTRMGALYKAEDFPSLEELVDKICAKFAFLPLPEVQEGSSLADCMRSELEARYEAGQKETWRRILDPVSRFVERLSQPDAIITQPAVKQLRDLVALTATVNLDSPELEQFRQAVESQLTRWDAEIVRKNPELRKELAATGQQLLAQFGALGQRKFMLEPAPAAEPLQAAA